MLSGWKCYCFGIIQLYTHRCMYYFSDKRTREWGKYEKKIFPKNKNDTDCCTIEIWRELRTKCRSNTRNKSKKSLNMKCLWHKMCAAVDIRSAYIRAESEENGNASLPAIHSTHTHHIINFLVKREKQQHINARITVIPLVPGSKLYDGHDWRRQRGKRNANFQRVSLLMQKLRFFFPSNMSSVYGLNFVDAV